MFLDLFLSQALFRSRTRTRPSEFGSRNSAQSTVTYLNSLGLAERPPGFGLRPVRHNTTRLFSNHLLRKRAHTSSTWLHRLARLYIYILVFVWIIYVRLFSPYRARPRAISIDAQQPGKYSLPCMYNHASRITRPQDEHSHRRASHTVPSAPLTLQGMKERSACRIQAETKFFWKLIMTRKAGNPSGKVTGNQEI